MAELLNNHGFCPICETTTTFRAYAEYLRSSYLCMRCRSVPRQRALMHVITQCYPHWRKLAIHESSPSDVAISRKIKLEGENYTATQFDPTRALGIIVDGVWRNENLEAQTFADESFDLVITQDVFEHVYRPDLAIIEIARTLRPGGAHVATTPLVKGVKPSERRARLLNDGQVEHIRPAKFHQNPIDPNGSLVTVDWGYDIAAYFDAHASLNTALFIIHDRNLGILGDLSEVLISIKGRSPII